MATTLDTVWRTESPATSVPAESLEWDSLAPQQFPDYLVWHEDCVPGATMGPQYALLRAGREIAFGSSYRRRDENGPVIEFPHGPAVRDAGTLIDFAWSLQRTEPDHSLVIEPYLDFDPKLMADFEALGFRRMSRDWIEYTVSVPLTADEQALFASLPKRIRRDVVHGRNGGAVVAVTTAEPDLAWFAEQQSAVARRVGIAPAPLPYVRRSCAGPGTGPLRGALFVMRVDGVRVAGALVLFSGRRGYYHKGYSAGPRAGTQLLQWEVMCYLARHGVPEYDLGGIIGPDSPDGVSAFKRAFSPRVRHMLPSLRWDPEPSRPEAG